MPTIPETLLHRPFARAEALKLGVTARVLEGPRFVRLHKGVYRHRSHEMSWDDLVTAASLALPASARTTGVTRLRQCGFDLGPRTPLHFVVQGDLHLDLAGVFLHRTVLMPPHDDAGVSIEAAFVAYCADARVLDAIKMGSMLLHQEALDGQLLEELLDTQSWRRGCSETRWVLPYLNADSRSMAEAEVLAYVLFAGVPAPLVNNTLELGDGVILTPDLWWPAYQRAGEYEGIQHQDDRGQYNSDIDRYGTYRKHDVGYVQITKERMRSPKSVVRSIHAELVAGGYDGPPPEFGDLWDLLFMRISAIVGPGAPRRAA